MNTNSVGECPTCQRLSYDKETLLLHDLVSKLGKTTIEEAIRTAMSRASVKKSRKEHVARAIRYFIGEIRSVRP